MVHARQLLLDVLHGVGQLLLYPGDVEEHAAVRRPSTFFHLAHDHAGDMIARQQLRWTARVLVPLRVPPSLFRIVRRL